ncbi:phosphatidylglycerophosphatase A [Cesiribacter sp. SM1]|uniref:phosphatidylglycerophosphatase A family protein n=1 Tax=Cesiribacter sp. SM1 TaxID=2861196 RepID=UPI001CD5E9EC|nr:phosphatidylglycerophosphatase A [Cesiribacter sp. SM1]
MIRVHKLISTSLGIGYIGKGGGTVAAAATCLCWYLASEAGGERFEFWSPFLVVVLSGVGVWSASAVEPHWGKDNNKVVIDEVSGMCIGLLFIPHCLTYTMLALLVFRYFDIIKPLYIKDLEYLKGGWGVMLDDIAAGIYTNVVLHLMMLFSEL